VEILIKWGKVRDFAQGKSRVQPLRRSSARRSAGDDRAIREQTTRGGKLRPWCAEEESSEETEKRLNKGLSGRGENTWTVQTKSGDNGPATEAVIYAPEERRGSVRGIPPPEGRGEKRFLRA